MDAAVAVKKSDADPFYSRQLDDEGQPFDVSQHLDVRGLTCPMPALKSLAVSQAMSTGEVLEIVGDWPGSKFEVPYAITGKPGLEVVRIVESENLEDETWWIYVRKLV